MKYILASLCLLLFFSCSVQKRRYQKGFYVQRESTLPAPRVKKDFPEKPDTRSLHADAKTTEPDFGLSQPKELIRFSGEDSCDVILFRDGTEIRARVTEVSATEVRYKRCDNVTGPNYVSRKTDLFQIRYANGMKELMKEEVPKTQSPSPRYQQPDRNPDYNTPSSPSPAANYALVSGILSLASLIFAFILPVLFVSSILSAINALRSARKFFIQDRMQPGAFAGRGKAIAGMTLALVTLSFYVLLIIVIIALI